MSTLRDKGCTLFDVLGHGSIVGYSLMRALGGRSEATAFDR